MPINHYIAETDGSASISAVWVKPKGKKTARIFNPSEDGFDPNEAARFSGADEGEIKRWLLARSKVLERR